MLWSVCLKYQHVCVTTENNCNSGGRRRRSCRSGDLRRATGLSEVDTHRHTLMLTHSGETAEQCRR